MASTMGYRAQNLCNPERLPKIICIMRPEGSYTNAEGVREFQPRVARASALPWDTEVRNRCNPERVAEFVPRGTDSIPYIALVVFNRVFPEKASKLVLKCNEPMMLLLSLNVPVDTIEM
jgi:hypothetical protein